MIFSAFDSTQQAAFHMASDEDKELQQALDLSLSGGSQDKQQTVQPAVNEKNENVVQLQPQQNTTSTSPLNLSSDAMALLLAALNSAHTADQIKMVGYHEGDE